MRKIIITLLSVAGILAASVTSTYSARPSVPHVDARVSTDRTQQIGTSYMDVGVTHTRFSLDSWGDPGSVTSARTLLQQASGYENQHIYGWGVTNPEPVPGEYDWASLDARVQMMRSIGGKLVLTLCCSPDWMTKLGTLTSAYPLWPPTPQHYKDYANLCAAIARRYPDIKYFIVWSELRGFWNYAANNWDYAAYTALYNAVYDALKAVNPDIQVGGPYIILEGSGTLRGTWEQEPPIIQRNMITLKYWMRHAHGYDFIALDRTAKADHDALTYPVAQVIRMTWWFDTIARQVRTMTKVPIWYSEERFQSGGWWLQEAGLASIMYYELKGGAAVSLSWQPQGISTDVNGGNWQNLFSDTRVPNGGKPFPYYDAFRDFHLYLGPGTKLYRTHSSDRDLEVLASSSHVLLINTKPKGITVSVNGRIVTMRKYGVTVVSG